MSDEYQTALEIVQIGDPVLRQTARELQKEEILSPLIHSDLYGLFVSECFQAFGYSKRRNKNAFYPHVACAQIVRGTILYLTYESEFDSFTSEPPPEPYEEAIRMVYDDESADN